jgi:sn-glycerol 3-phosphate transport system permease protein
LSVIWRKERSSAKKARVKGSGWLGILWRAYMPAARPVYLT